MGCNNPIAVKKNTPELLLEYGWRCSFMIEVEGKNVEACFLTKKDQLELESYLNIYCQ
jgi:hypothetical protein